MSRAWILDFGDGQRAAVAHAQQLLLVHEPETHVLAFTRPEAERVLFWNGRCVPVLDAARALGGTATGRTAQLGLYVFAAADGAAAIGALWLAGAPLAATVDDAQACELPPSREGWRAACVACFRDERDAAVPVIDLARLFGARGLSDASPGAVPRASRRTATAR